MDILVGICGTTGDKDGKYFSTSGIQRFWIKADILPLCFAVFIDNEVGRSPITKNQKNISQEDYYALCSMITSLTLKAVENGINFDCKYFALQGSLEEYSGPFFGEELESMVINWIGIEEDTYFINMEAEEVIKELEKNTS